MSDAIFAVHKRSGIVHRTEGSLEDGLFTLCGKRVGPRYRTTHERSLNAFGVELPAARCAKCDQTVHKRRRSAA